jgi:hypothetical protein
MLLVCASRYKRVIGDARAEIALNILGFLIGLYYAAVIKTRCPPALRGVGSTSRRPLLSPAERDDGGQAPGVLHHVMGRGIERKRLFIDKRERQDFNTRLAALAFEKLCTFCTSVP